MKKTAIYIILFILSMSFIQKKGVAQKTDTIIHINGDILTGELKKMIYGVATWKMEGMGTINMEEVKINTIRSKKIFEIKMKSGETYFGSFDTSAVDRKVYVIQSTKKVLINIEDIVEIYPIKRNFWMRTSGNFSLGLNASKGSDIATGSFSGDLDYRKKKSYIHLPWDLNYTFQGDSLSSSKIDVSLGWQRLIKKKWSTALVVGASQNTELGIKLRLDLSALGLRDFLYNSWNRFYAGAGLTVASETPYGDAAISNDLAGIVQLVWKVYKFTNPKVWVNTNINLVPYITGEWRYRAVFNLNPQVSIINDDFKIGFTFYFNYDSRPPSDASSTTDFGINLQLSYKFH